MYDSIFFQKNLPALIGSSKPVPMTITEIKTELSIKDVLAHYGYAVNKNKHINCPFHDDKTPSMRVYEETNTVYCFSGNCSTHGRSLDVIDFAMKKEACSKHKALLKCKELLGHVPRSKTTIRAIDEVWKALKKSLSCADKAKAYLKKRGLPSAGIGYHSGQLLKSKLTEQVKEVGLYVSTL